MSNLTDKKCVPCEGGTPPLTGEEIEKYLKELKSEWNVLDNKKISKEFKFTDFKDSMKFINKVAEIAEAEQHHPDIHVFYNKVLIELWTHAVHGLSENDFILAAKIEAIK